MSSAKDIAQMRKTLARVDQQLDQRLAAEKAPPEQPTPTRAAKRLNAHHERYMAGFYPTAVCSRAFGARVRAGSLEITDDFEAWYAVDLAQVSFNDHNGRKIHL